MHHDVYQQIKLGEMMHEAYGEWSHAKKSGEDPETIAELYTRYKFLLDLMDDYVPDPKARF
jgi:hypothetical protein